MRLPKTLSHLLIPLMFGIIPSTLLAAECSAKSGAQTVPLLELYTSEGCSSCPPADKWLSDLKLGADKVIPLAFHVDYWDSSRLHQGIDSSLKQAARANLSLNASQQVNGEILIKATAQAVNSAEAKHADIFIAIYENKLVSQVHAGENNGRELKHDYVVRDLLGAYQLNNKNEFAKSITLKQEWKGRNAGAVIFVQDTRNGSILQSLQLPFCT